MTEYTKPAEIVEKIGDITYHHSMLQGTLEWDDARRGMITASGLKNLITPTLKQSSSADTRMYIYELAAQRLTPSSGENFQSYAMMRGHLEESEARNLYIEKINDAKECGFIVNREYGFPIGFSPDLLIGSEGFGEIKSRLPKLQVQTIYEHLIKEDKPFPIPKDFMMQVQGGMFITKRKYCDFLSYSNGFNMAAIPCEPIPAYQDAIETAVIAAEKEIVKICKAIRAEMESNKTIFPVEWIDHNEEIKA